MDKEERSRYKRWGKLVVEEDNQGCLSSEERIVAVMSLREPF